jgi:hypothetical protein
MASPSSKILGDSVAVHAAATARRPRRQWGTAREDLGSEAVGEGEVEGRERRVKAEERVVDAMDCSWEWELRASGVSSSGRRRRGIR